MSAYDSRWQVVEQTDLVAYILQGCCVGETKMQGKKAKKGHRQLSVRKWNFLDLATSCNNKDTRCSRSMFCSVEQLKSVNIEVTGRVRSPLIRDSSEDHTKKHKGQWILMGVSYHAPAK